MEDFFAHPAFHLIGVVIVCAVAFAVAALLGIFAIALVVTLSPATHYSKPKTDMVLATYRRDYHTAEGKRIKIGGDLRISRILGFSWKTRWIAGVLLFEPHTEER